MCALGHLPPGGRYGAAHPYKFQLIGQPGKADKLINLYSQKGVSYGKDKKEAISIAHKTSMPSIISSGLSFFAATFGVACYSQVEMIGSICTLLARGAIISMVVVILILPAMFMIFDKLICKTSIGFLKKKTK